MSNLKSNLSDDLIDRQTELEMESRMLGAQAYMKAHERGLESDTRPGQELLRKAVEPTADRIIQFLESAMDGKAGRKHNALPYLAKIDPLQAAYLTARGAIDGAAALKRSAQNVAITIADSLEDHLNLTKLATEKKGLFKKVEKQVQKSTSARHRTAVYDKVIAKYSKKEVSWDAKEKLLVGMKLLELFIEATGMVKLVRVTTASHTTSMEVQFEDSWLPVLEKAHEQCSLLCPQFQPMLTPPRPWTNAYTGGYLTNTISTPLVATANRAYLDELGGVDLSRVLASINAVQATGWQINAPVYDVVRELWDNEGNSPVLPEGQPAPLPVRPYGIPVDMKTEHMTMDQLEALKVWKVSASKVHEQNSKRVARRVQVAKALAVAGKFRDEPVMYFPHFVDFRGRVYPYPAYLSPQGNDIAKGLLRFAEGKPLGETGAYWLAVHLANTFGVDKVPFEERIDWVMENEEMILSSALSPLDGDRAWEEADSPLCFLAACFEWAGYKLQGDAFVSHLPIHMDGSCSGLQHFSALLRDPVGGAAVNLVPGPRPADIYTQVYKRAQQINDDLVAEGPDAKGWSPYAATWVGKYCRSVSKHPTMTLCYSATKLGMARMIEKAVVEMSKDKPYLELQEGQEVYGAAVFAAKTVWDALGDVVVAARGAMDWLQAASKVLSKANLPMRWTTPLGLPVMQAYREETGKVVEAFVGGQRVQLTLVKGTEKIDARRQATGIAPNFVHSMDGAHLMRTALLCKENGVSSLAVIHDSFGTHAADTETLHAVIREAFVQQYRENRLEQFRDEIVSHLEMVDPGLVAELPPLPPVGTLDLEAVRESDYLFA